MNPDSLILLPKAAELLGYKSLRSLRRWCGNNKVAILSDVGSRKKYLLRVEFDAARLQTLIAHLKNHYGQAHWQKAFDAHLNDDVLGLLTVLQVTTKNVTSNIPKGIYAEEFLSDLKTALNRAKSKP